MPAGSHAEPTLAGRLGVVVSGVQIDVGAVSGGGVMIGVVGGARSGPGAGRGRVR